MKRDLHKVLRFWHCCTRTSALLSLVYLLRPSLNKPPKEKNGKSRLEVTKTNIFSFDRWHWWSLPGLQCSQRHRNILLLHDSSFHLRTRDSSQSTPPSPPTKPKTPIRRKMVHVTAVLLILSSKYNAELV